MEKKQSGNEVFLAQYLNLKKKKQLRFGNVTIVTIFPDNV